MYIACMLRGDIRCARCLLERRLVAVKAGRPIEGSKLNLIPPVCPPVCPPFVPPVAPLPASHFAPRGRRLSAGGPRCHEFGPTASQRRERVRQQSERKSESERAREKERASERERERARARARARTSERGWNASFGSWQHLGICSKLEIAVQQRGITTIDLTGSAVKNLESVTCTNSAYLYYSLNR